MKINLNIKIFLNESSDSEFVIRNWSTVNDQANANYSAGNEIIYSTERSESNFCDQNDSHILERVDIRVIGLHVATEVTFKINCAQFIKFITKIDGTATDEAEYLDLVMLMYNLLE